MTNKMRYLLRENKVKSSPLKDRVSSIRPLENPTVFPANLPSGIPTPGMAEEIESIVSKLCIEDDEGDIIDLGEVNPNEEDNKLLLLLMGWSHTERPYNVEAFKRTMMNVWAPKNGMVIRVLSPNMYAFQFFHWRDKERILEGGLGVLIIP